MSSGHTKVENDAMDAEDDAAMDISGELVRAVGEGATAYIVGRMRRRQAQPPPAAVATWWAEFFNAALKGVTGEEEEACGACYPGRPCAEHQPGYEPPGMPKRQPIEMRCQPCSGTGGLRGSAGAVKCPSCGGAGFVVT